MEKCNFCLYREGCIGQLPGPDGKCIAFAVSTELKTAYEEYLSGQAQKPDFAALCHPTADELIDPTGTPLTPSYHGKDCLGNGDHEIECQCDECDYYLTYFPELDNRGGQAND